MDDERTRAVDREHDPAEELDVDEPVELPDREALSIISPDSAVGGKAGYPDLSPLGEGPGGSDTGGVPRQ